MLKQCSRCKREIDCKADTNETCACSKVPLDKDTLDYLAKTQLDCLCNQCLKELSIQIKGKRND